MFTEAAPDNPPRFLRIRDVLDRVPISRPTIYRRIAEGSFPKPAKFGSRAAWLESEIDAYVQSKVDAR